MSLMRLGSCLLILAGSVLTVVGMDSGVRASCEVSEEITPAQCIPAHQVPPVGAPFEDDPSLGCVNYYYIWCWPDPEIGCWTEGYGTAAPGECEHSLGDPATHRCYENYRQDPVVLQYHRSECEFYEANCECIWIIGEYAPIQETVCNCVDVL
ncbi:hypothetical protein SH661x_000653 [Planctomicrobium sp. SH661]|uniref:hypothetical protein n=1 Tax=Planctomicrobium sp. SH661 TaxID=3448124 RepID=UPI003F5C0FE6